MKAIHTVSIIALAIGLASPAFAAESAADAPAAGAPAPVGLEDIVVTATRRSENLQTVPVAVSAISSAQLANKGVFETSDLNHSVPNLQVSSPYGEQQPNFSVRGVGVGTEFNANAASPVGVYVDEVYQAFRASHGQQLYDLDQIEVVRGPQGTLYGRNTTGGAINFITRKPSLTGTNGSITLGYGTYNRVNGEAAIEVTPVEDKVGLRIAGTYVNSDPYVHNVLPAGLNTSAAGGASGLNHNSGISPGGYESWGIRGTLRFKPVDTLDITLKGYAAESRGGDEAPIPIGQTKGSDVIDYTNSNFLLAGIFQQLGGTLLPTSYSQSGNHLGINELQLDSNGSALTRAEGVVLNVTAELADHLKLISITGYDSGRYAQLPNTDCDGSPLRLCSIGYESRFHAFNQDLRFDYNGGAFKMIVGGFYGKDHITSDNRPDFFNFLSDVRSAVGLPASYFNPGGALNGTALSATSLPTGIRATNHFQQERESWAIYGEGSYELTPALKFTAGLRYTSDKNHFYDGMTTYFDDAGTARLITVSNFQGGALGNSYFLQPVYNEAGEQVIPSYQGLAPLPGGLDRRGSSNRISGRAILDWKPIDGVMVYASYSRGYRAGTFNGLAYGSAAQVYYVRPEQVNAYEVGFKTRFMDNRLQINGALFYYDYKGQQGQVVDATATANLIALDGTLKGVELDIQFQATDHLKLSASGGLLDSKYKDYDQAKCAATNLAGKFPGQDGSCVLSSGGNVSVGGNPFPYAAKSSLNLGVDWDIPQVLGGKVMVHGDAAYTGHYYFDSFADYSRGPLTHVTTGDFANGGGKYWVLNSRISWTSGRYTLAIWGKNLTDKVYYPYGISLENLFGNGYRVRAQPRTMGVEAKVAF